MAKNAYSKSVTDKMEKSVNHLRDELKKLRTGRPSASLFADMMVDYYGAPTPVSQTSTVTVGEDRSVSITPWDKSLLEKIEKTINSSNLGLHAINDGVVVRVNFPAPTVEDRKKWVKIAKDMLEDTKVSLRNIRRDELKLVKEDKDNGDLPEDDAKKVEDEIQNILKDHEKKVDEIFAKKEKEIMES
ncbi:ribosome recycling factor [Oceanotoga sp. DSM 15011]|jgi:ribosome recycling factor|uniref:Ribosome-recycling factor n=1 Tax=Oceanotoga teriensis TaxID=515440 RepID=A0AA45C730_9BACT|nr:MULTISPECIES: ribosome recycling factor [Oceanotoga]MDN5343568.1 ribosome recycling factor [Oceanotoga sp.]MDO7975932.1 ribosome recycling factor [Oceanotoga teriensis]PWJ95086.1 ribosome recycling factor [Oceanotoga teriensis]UYO99082.1 ribosome recycling factor [Oceanotoga sp. DSM 15011]